MTERKHLQNDNTQAALDALAFVCRTLGWLEVVPPYGDAVSRTKECDTAIKQCEKIRAALTAPDVNAEKYDALFGTIESQKQTHDAFIRMNRELLEALKWCVKALDGGATDAEANIAMSRGYEALARAEQKGK